MNIEDLNKSQLLLLTILVNFIMSIATGILTVSLLDQAPPIVSQTVNRIVEQTVQTVAPGIASVVTKQTTVVDKQQDLVVAAIAAQAARTVTIYAGASTSTAPLAVGTYLPKSRAVVTATNVNVSLPAQATVMFPNGTSEAVSLARSTNSITIYGFADSAKLPAIASPALLATTTLAQGETVIALASDGSALIGIISRISAGTIHTTLGTVPFGSGVVNLDGDLVGISAGTAGLYISAKEANTALTATSTPATSQ